MWIPRLIHNVHLFSYLARYAQPWTSWSTVVGLSQAVYPRQDLLGYIPKTLQWQVNMATIKSLMAQELRQLQGHSSQEAQISFIGGCGKRGLQAQEERGKGGEARGFLDLPVPHLP